MSKIGLVFPHQLFQTNPLLAHCNEVMIVEEHLFFAQYNFHKQKLAFHRATMKYYEQLLLSNNIKVTYVNAHEKIADIRELIPYLASKNTTEIVYIDVTDNYLSRRLTTTASKHNIATTALASPLFLNNPEDINTYFKDKKRMSQTDFYTHQRKLRNILMDENNKPQGGKWTFDTENRLKYPKGKVPPYVALSKQNEFDIEGIKYVNHSFSDNYGKIANTIKYPSTHAESEKWFDEFLEQRFREFGDYEDAIVTKELVINHSIITPMLNVGLLTPDYVVEKTLRYAEAHQIPMNSCEGFIRQITGWREFMRAVYQLKGTEERTKNYWNFKRKIPASFWNGTTGIEPIDSTIKKVLETGYCHHIERLMVLGNFMLLCEFDPNEVYRWFMELFIDAYDWVMVPNVYGMSQFADGGLMSTKPYISGSNYLMKMSDYPKGDWQIVWDGLFWRFMHEHRDFFLKNPRLGMLIHTFDKMSDEKRNTHLNAAAKYLASLD